MALHDISEVLDRPALARLVRIAQAANKGPDPHLGRHGAPGPLSRTRDGRQGEHMDSDRPGRVLAELRVLPGRRTSVAGKIRARKWSSCSTGSPRRCPRTARSCRARRRPGARPHARGLRAAAAGHQGELPPSPPAAAALPRRTAGRAATWSRSPRARPGSRRSGRASLADELPIAAPLRAGVPRQLPRRRSGARWRWSASRSAPGSAACSPRPAAATSPPRATRSRW